jgi:hypothetical protein
LIERASMAAGRFIPNLLQALTEFDHGSQHLVSIEKLAQLPAPPSSSSFGRRTSICGERCASVAALSCFVSAKHRPYHPAPVVPQHVHAIGEQRPYGVSVYRGAVAHDVRRRRKAADVSEAKRSKQADE